MLSGPKPSQAPVRFFFLLFKLVPNERSCTCYVEHCVCYSCWLIYLPFLALSLKICLLLQPANKKSTPTKPAVSRKGDGSGQIKASKAVEAEDVEVNKFCCLVFMC